MDLLRVDGFDEAIIGVSHKKGSKGSLVYSYEKCVSILMKRDEIDYNSAVELMEYSVIDSYVTEETPIFVQIGEDFKRNLRLQYDNDGYIGCFSVYELQYPSILVNSSSKGFNCITFKHRGFVPNEITWEKITLIIESTKDQWCFYNARIA